MIKSHIPPAKSNGKEAPIQIAIDTQIALPKTGVHSSTLTENSSNILFFYIFSILTQTKIAADDILIFTFIFQRNLCLIFHVNPLPSRGFT